MCVNENRTNKRIEVVYRVIRKVKSLVMEVNRGLRVYLDFFLWDFEIGCDFQV